MPRANRHYQPGYVWHIPHRCHRRQFLLRFARDRRDWVRWLYEAHRRFGLCIFDYCVTSNHIHLLVRDQGRGEIAASMQLIAGRVGQAYNARKHRPGAFWTDRYHATAVDTEVYLARCMAYIDLNMVRAGVVEDPAQWEWTGYHELQGLVRRFGVVDRVACAQALGLRDVSELAAYHREWIGQGLRQARNERQAQWTESLAVGHREFVTGVQAGLGITGRYRTIEAWDDGWVVREPAATYATKTPLKTSC